jgi:hypothetical protein
MNVEKPIVARIRVTTNPHRNRLPSQTVRTPPNNDLRPALLALFASDVE